MKKKEQTRTVFRTVFAPCRGVVKSRLRVLTTKPFLNLFDFSHLLKKDKIHER